MIQFNLLPDVKLEFVKAQRIKHAVVSGAVIASGAALIVFTLLFIAVHMVQTKVISDQTKDIAKYNQQLKDTKDIDKILTIQNQLGALPALHAGKPSVSRIFDLIRQLTPTSVGLNEVSVDFATNAISVKGVASSQDQTNTMIDTMKYATYRLGDKDGSDVFSNVVLQEFSRTAKTATFTINANYDTVIFDNAQTVSFSVPSGRSTQSFLGAPESLFVKQPTSGN